ncbi:VWA domain-containing protein [Lysobacter sp. 5GHs7-4]|uniref:vWA domain-containing protein n=1 Tax=Lysobacter sp. 5GHs7-4 TaxID=2904253 RepID=UPI001E53108D|nr:vWA domain-containing protein [Lysobacter sp. 5GHs7-4]UHQ22246.1 VWA domain-containing protein [Lysobacter sp. 5GHs7-4]
MKPQLPLWRLGAMLLALFVGTDAVAATASPNVTAASTSEPKLNGTGDAWAPFGNALGFPNSSKSIKVFYLSDDLAVYPLNGAGATVQLRPKGGGPMINCTFNAGVPVMSGTNGGTCTFRMSNTAGQIDTLEVFHLGMLSGDIRLTATGITASGGGNTVDAYDSDTVIPGTPPAPAVGPPLSRLPARLVLVFDKSGSMAWSSKLNGDPVCGALYAPNPDCQRWRVLRRATEQMISVAKAYQLPTDKLGVVFFDHDATNTGGIAAMSSVNLDAVLSEIDKPAHQPSGGTSIGDGIENLQSALVGGDNASFNNTMLLFTDGAQNTSKFVVWDGLDLRLNATNSPIGGELVRPAGKQLSLCPFRLRLDDPSDPDSSSLLQNIANYSGCGALNIETTLDNPPAGAIQYFLQVLADTLIGDKLELLHTAKGAQADPGGREGPPIDMAFKTSKKDLAFTVLLGWDKAFQADGRPNIKLSKDGVDFDPLHNPRFTISGGNGHIALTLRAPFCDAHGKCVSPDGDWKMQVNSTLARGPSHWNLFVIADNASIYSRYAVSQNKAGIGEPLQLKATLTEGGKPLTGLAAGTVRAFISGPAESLGNILAAGKAKAGDAPQGDALSAAGLKAQAMLNDPAQRDKLLAALELGAEKGIELKETSPGVYTGEYPATLAEGVYQVTYRIDSSSPDNGGFTRVYTTDHYVQVAPDAAATAKTIKHEPARACPSTFAGGCVQVTLKPVDAKGNLVGPGKGASVQLVQPFEGGLVGDVIDNLDGSYRIVIGYNKKGMAPPVLRIDGLELKLPDAVGTGGKGGGSIVDSGDKPIWMQWWVWLIALLVLLILILLMRRK